MTEPIPPDEEAERVLHPEEANPLEALAPLEDALQRGMRGVRAKILPRIDSTQPTWIEKKTAERPLTAASIAMGTGALLGLVVRRLTPWRLG